MLLDTSYLGMRLPHPFVAGASPFGYHVDTVKRLEDAGWAAVVLHSLFEEQVGLVQEGRIAHLDPDDQRFAETMDISRSAVTTGSARTSTRSTSTGLLGR